MTTLEEIFTKKITVKTDPHVEIVVRAVNLLDVLKVSQNHLNAIQSIMGLVESHSSDIELIQACFSVFPDFCKEVMALSSGLTPREIDILPFPLQLEILATTASLTFSTPESLKKAQGVILEIASKMAPLTQQTQ